MGNISNSSSDQKPQLHSQKPNNSIYDPQFDQSKFGVIHNDNKFWRMVRQGMTKSLTEAFKQNLIDCYQVIVKQSGHTIVHQSIILDRHELFKLCQIYGADWDQPDLKGVTPLMKAVALNRVFYAQKLIELGVDKDLKDQRGMSAKDYGEYYQNYQLLDILDQ